MNRNVEIKARVDDLAVIGEIAEQLAGAGPTVLEQEDTFFVCSNGRLKLRCTRGSPQGELIFYRRADVAGPKESHYAIHRTLDAHGLLSILSAALGVRAVVRKRRTIYLIGRARVHLDEVEGLGRFVELEVVLQEGQSVSEGIAISHDLMTKLGIPQDGLIEKAYVDLLLKA
ncbi:MAG: class IV adenylate cyclase [Sedimentisphaerales bacterium]|nr:class IV adenylate cyclase [Sedimentisphaerales bacterium]